MIIPNASVSIKNTFFTFNDSMYFWKGHKIWNNMSAADGCLLVSRLSLKVNIYLNLLLELLGPTEKINGEVLGTFCEVINKVSSSTVRAISQSGGWNGIGVSLCVPPWDSFYISSLHILHICLQPYFHIAFSINPSFPPTLKPCFTTGPQSCR